ncbi:ATP-binding protein [Thermodesulfobacteriota bacterium]
MILSIASGKGGTGKTTIATGLATVLGARAQLLDCDVEEPNCHILMKPEIEVQEAVSVPVPRIDEEKCNLCGKCDEVCSFSAIVTIGGQVLTFPALCHGCGACSLLCPQGAIVEDSRELGVVESGKAGDVDLVQGVLRVGEAMSPPLIKALKRRINRNKIAILDAPPGASCPVMHTVMGSDFIVLVTEPTPFGLHDLKIAVEAVSSLNIPLGVVLNRSDLGDREVQAFCATKSIPVLMEIPHDRRVAEGYAAGKLLVDCSGEYVERMLQLFHGIESYIAQWNQPAKEAAS